MRKIIVALLSLSTASTVFAQTAVDPYVIVVGDAVVEATPDRAWISIGAESRSKTSKDAQQRNAQAMSAVMQRLSVFGIAKDAIKTTAIDLQMEFDYADGKQTPRGFVARNTVEARVDDLAMLGDVIDAVVASGATAIHGLRFDVKQRDQLRAAALQSAVKDALAKAQAITQGAGRGVGAIIRIEELPVDLGPVPMMRPFAMASRAEAATPFAAGTIEIRAQVRVTVALR
jgi:uncharacterized protein YggE